MDEIKEMNIDVFKSELLKTIMDSVELKSQIRFTMLNCKSRLGCQHINPAPIAKKYNLPYDSDLAYLISIVLKDNE